MPKRIPVVAAERFAKEQKCQQVIVLAWDGECTHVVTYGINPTHCKQAAQGGQKIATFLGLTTTTEPTT